MAFVNDTTAINPNVHLSSTIENGQNSGSNATTLWLLYQTAIRLNQCEEFTVFTAEHSVKYNIEQTSLNHHISKRMRYTAATCILFFFKYTYTYALFHLTTTYFKLSYICMDSKVLCRGQKQIKSANFLLQTTCSWCKKQAKER